MSPWSRTRPAGCRRPPRSPPVAPAPRCADSTHLGQLSSPALSNRLPWYLSWERIHLQCRRPQFNSWVGKIWRRDRLLTPVFSGFPGVSAGKESARNAGDLGSISGLGRSPGEGKAYPPQYSGLENSMDYIYSPWGCKESDTTEQLSL